MQSGGATDATVSKIAANVVAIVAVIVLVGVPRGAEVLAAGAG